MAEKRINYKVETVREAKMVHSFVKFTYRQAHPKVSRNFIIIGVLSLALTYGIRIPDLRIVLWLLGAFCLLMGAFRHWIPITMMKSSDPDYTGKNILTYVFTDDDITALRNGEEFLHVDGYSRVTNLYHDEWYYYLGANMDDLMILPKASFVTGDPERFGDFIYERSGVACRWSPATRAEKRIKNRADAAVRAAKAQEMQEAQAAEMERRRELMREARRRRKNK